MFLKFFVGNREAGGEARELRKGHGIRGEGHHGKEQLAGVEAGIEQAFGLLLPDALDGAAHAFLAAFFVDDFFFAPLQGFPFEQLDPLAVAAGELEPDGQSFHGFLGRVREPGGAFGNFPAQDFAEEAFLVAEVMIQHALVDARAAGDDIDARAGEALGGKFLKRGFENALLSLLGISGARFLHRLLVRYSLSGDSGG